MAPDETSDDPKKESAAPAAAAPSTPPAQVADAVASPPVAKPKPGKAKPEPPAPAPKPKAKVAEGRVRIQYLGSSGRLVDETTGAEFDRDGEFVEVDIATWERLSRIPFESFTRENQE